VAVVQLLAVYGADMTVVDEDGETARRTAQMCSKHALVAFSIAIAYWEPVRIAIGCRL